jgi:shikimate kinase
MAVRIEEVFWYSQDRTMHTLQNNQRTNVVLIGMAGAGKSTVGRELANQTGLVFVDVDTVIEKNRSTPLQKLLTDLGAQGFRELEEQTLVNIDLQNHIIATGGSAIYSEAGMEHLKKSSVMVLLDISLTLSKQRVGDFSSRGLVKPSNQSFEQLFAERQPLYAKHADVTIDCNNRSVSDVCATIKDQVSDSIYHL